MQKLYDFDLESVEELLDVMATNLKRRRLEKGLSREVLSLKSGVPVPTIAKFERCHQISLSSYVALCKAMGYKNSVKSLMDKPLYSTIEELDLINSNKNRKRGRKNEFVGFD